MLLIRFPSKPKVSMCAASQMSGLDVCDPRSGHNGVWPAARLCAFGKLPNRRLRWLRK
jgi:hypothetical protein